MAGFQNLLTGENLSIFPPVNLVSCRIEYTSPNLLRIAKWLCEFLKYVTKLKKKRKKNM